MSSASKNLSAKIVIKWGNRAYLGKFFWEEPTSLRIISRCLYLVYIITFEEWERVRGSYRPIVGPARVSEEAFEKKVLSLTPYSKKVLA